MSASSAPGSSRSSASRKATHSPRTIASAAVSGSSTRRRWLAVGRGRRAGRARRLAATMSAVPSVDASSTTMTSSGIARSARTESSARSMVASAFQVGTRIDRRGASDAGAGVAAGGGLAQPDGVLRRCVVGLTARSARRAEDTPRPTPSERRDDGSPSRHRAGVTLVSLTSSLPPKIWRSSTTPMPFA